MPGAGAPTPSASSATAASATRARRRRSPASSRNRSAQFPQDDSGLEESNDLAAFLDRHALSGRLRRKSGHGHDVSRARDDEARSGGAPHFIDHDPEALRPSE